MVDDRSDDGQFTPEHTDAEILAAVRAHEPAATSEVAGEVGMTRQGADRRLRTLRDAGEVSSKKIGASLVWFAPSPAADGSKAGTERVQSEATAEADASPSPHGVDIESLSYTRELTPARRAQLDAWLQFVRESGDGVQKSDFEKWWTDERYNETGYDTGSFWEAFAKAAMKQSNKFDKPNARTYRWAGGSGGVDHE